MTITNNRGELFRLLLRDAYEQKTVKLASGRESDFYIDCRQVTLTALGHFLVGRVLLHELAGRTLAAVGGLELGACPLISAVSTLSLVADGAQPQAYDGFYVRKATKDHGAKKLIEGANGFIKGCPVAIIEDVTTTGGSALQAVQAARDAGMDVKLVMTLVDREEGGRESIERFVPFQAIFTASDFRRGFLR